MRSDRARIQFSHEADHPSRELRDPLDRHAVLNVQAVFHAQELDFRQKRRERIVQLMLNARGELLNVVRSTAVRRLRPMG